MLMDTVRALAFFMIESAQERNHKALTSERYANLSLARADLGKDGLKLVSLGLVAAKCCLCQYIVNLEKNLLTCNRF